MHGKEPPPVEILENLTARGGNIVNRTTENFQPVTKTNLGNESDSENEESKTPKEDKMDLDEPTSGTRSTRGTSLILDTGAFVDMSFKACDNNHHNASSSSPKWALRDRLVIHLEHLLNLHSPRLRPTLLRTILPAPPSLLQITSRSPKYPSHSAQS